MPIWPLAGPLRNVSDFVDRQQGFDDDERALDAEQSKQRDIEGWYAALSDANTYEEWLAAAENLDCLEGAEEWKNNPDSDYYDCKLIRDRLQDMSRHVGTKRLIHQHQSVLAKLLWEVANARNDVLSLDQRLSFFTEARHSLGKTALLLSGGAGLGMYHFGVIKALSKQQLLPRVIAGSSAGSIVAAIVGTLNRQELELLYEDDQKICQHFSEEKLKFFGGKGPADRENIKRLLTTGSLMDVQQLQKALIANLGHVTFHEAYEKTGRIINITVSPGNNYESPRLLNYLTAPTVLIWSAASASCALPGLFSSVELLTKNSRGEIVPYFAGAQVMWTDGSLHTDLPTARLQELFNVNYFIVSQTNPHALPFFQYAQRDTVKHRPSASKPRPSLLRKIASKLWFLASSELAHRLRQAVYLGLLPSGVGRLLNQKYEGDVTILPPVSFKNYVQALSNPTPESLYDFVKQGLRIVHEQVAERLTWPNIAMIHSQCQLEIVLDECVRALALEAKQSFAEENKETQDSANAPVRTHRMLQNQRHTHMDLNTYFGTATVLNGSHHNLQVFDTATSKDKLQREASDADASVAGPAVILQEAEPSASAADASPLLVSPTLAPSASSAPTSVGRGPSSVSTPYSTPCTPTLSSSCFASPHRDWAFSRSFSQSARMPPLSLVPLIEPSPNTRDSSDTQTQVRDQDHDQDQGIEKKMRTTKQQNLEECRKERNGEDDEGNGKADSSHECVSQVDTVTQTCNMNHVLSNKAAEANHQSSRSLVQSWSVPNLRSCFELDLHSVGEDQCSAPLRRVTSEAPSSAAWRTPCATPALPEGKEEDETDGWAGDTSTHAWLLMGAADCECVMSEQLMKACAQ